MVKSLHIVPEHDAPIVPPELPDNIITAFVKRQSKVVKITGLAVVGVVVLLSIVLSYVSVLSKHPTIGQATTAKTTHFSKTSNAATSTSKGDSTATTSPTTSAPKTGTAVSPNGSLSKNGSVTSGGTEYPSAILNLTNWKLTLPVGSSSSNTASEIDQPQLATYLFSPYFQLDSAKDGVQFQAPINGATTSGSNFPRSELREMTNNGQQQASWSTTSGTSTMTVREAVTHLPVARPQLVAAQVHGPSAYVILIRLNGSDLFVEGDNGKNLGDLNTNYTLGTVFTVQIVATGGHILVSYNGTQKVDTANNSSGNYFKAGCYTQSNPSYGDSPSAYGQTIIYDLSVSHT